MRIKSIVATMPLLIGFVAIFLSSCKKNAVTLAFTNAKDEVPQLGNLVFRFSHSLAKDSMLNAWDSTDYISFEPRIPGRFRWESPDQLVFSPSEPLLPATSYTAKIRNTVFKYSKYNKLSGDEKISFHTPPLTLENSQITWLGESGTAAVPQLELLFNYRVDPSELKEKLTIEIDGAEVNYNMVSTSIDNRVAIRLLGIKQEDRDIETNVIIAKGLKPHTGNTATAEPITSTLSIPSPYVLMIQDMQAEHDGADGVVRIITSQQLGGENIRSFLRFDPEINYTIEPSENGFSLRSDRFDVEKSYVLTILKGLRGKIGGILKEDYNGNVAFGELEAGISFTNSKAVYLSKKGSKNMEVKITNVPRVKLVISKIYENNLLLAQRYGYYPQESRARQASYDGEYVEDYYEVSYGGETMLGDVIFEKEIDTRSLPKSGGGRLLNFSQFEDRLPDFKGVYHISIRSTEQYWIRDSRFISLSDIGLIAKEGEDKIYVFTNSLKTAEPVNGVNVAVYAANNQLIGMGSTNAEGVAEIKFSKKDFAGFRPAMVIAKTADDFNYLPFNNTRVNTSRFEVGGKRNNPSGLDAFVYAERDIYRPGEKVNFAVVVRDRKWESPGEMPLKLKFLMPNGKELRNFRKSLDEQGSTEGSVDIASSAITGSYTLEVYTSNDILLASKNFYRKRN